MLRALTIAMLAAACGPAAVPRAPTVCPPPKLARLEFRPEGAPDLFASVALDVPRPAPQALVPRAFVRTGDRASAPAITAARLAIDRGDCRPATRALAALPATHADRDYVAYLEAWCQSSSGDRATARRVLTQLAASSADEQLRPFLADDLFEVLVRGDVHDALVAIEELRGDIRISPDRLAVGFYAAGRHLEGRLVVARLPDATPEGAEAACRVKLAECGRAITARASWAMVWRTCTDPLPARPAPSACVEAEPLAELGALYAWRGEDLTPDARQTFRDAVQRWLAPAAQHPRFDFAGRDRLALAMLASNWGEVEPLATAWHAVETLAVRIFDRTTDPGVARAASAVALAASRNARLLEDHELCRDGR